MKCFIVVQYIFTQVLKIQFFMQNFVAICLAVVLVCLDSLGRRLKNKEKPSDKAQEDGNVSGSDDSLSFFLFLYLVAL